MSWFGGDSQCSQNYDQYNNTPKQGGSITHELLGGAVAYEATKAYENHVAENGPPPSHAKAKELLAGFVGAGLEKHVETHDLGYVDQNQARDYATQQVYQGYDNQCGGGGGGGGGYGGGGGGGGYGGGGGGYGGGGNDSYGSGGGGQGGYGNSGQDTGY